MRRQAIRAAMKEGTPAGQDIMDEIDRMSHIGSPLSTSGLISPESPPRSHLWASPVADPAHIRDDSSAWPSLAFHRPFRDGRRNSVGKPGFLKVSATSAASGGLDSDQDSDREGLLEQGVASMGRPRTPVEGQGHKAADRRTALEHEV